MKVALSGPFLIGHVQIYSSRLKFQDVITKEKSFNTEVDLPNISTVFKENLRKHVQVSFLFLFIANDYLLKSNGNYILLCFRIAFSESEGKISITKEIKL